MKYWLPIGLLLWLLSHLFGACKTQQRIPYNADRLEITTPYPDSALYESTLTFLDQEGYIVNKSDSKRGQIVTDYKSITNTLVAVRLIISIKESKISFRGEGQAQGLGYRVQNQELNYDRHANNLQKKGFRVIDDVARRLSRRLPKSTYVYANGNIIYTAGK
ncbi:hypothetical protein [Spirosoma fluminis]